MGYGSVECNVMINYRLMVQVGELYLRLVGTQRARIADTIKIFMEGLRWFMHDILSKRIGNITVNKHNAPDLKASF